jgi:GntR family transcriptional regulator
MSTASEHETGPHLPDKSAEIPLWEQVRRDISRRLEAGEFGGTFPGEFALVEQYGVSRHTIREALRSLREEGIVTAHRGRTSKIAQPTEIEQPLGTLYSLFAAVEAGGKTQRSIVRRIEILEDAEITARLGGVPSGTPLLYLERLRLADDTPLALDRIWFPADIAGKLVEVDFTRTAFYDQLYKVCGVRLTGGHEDIRAVLGTARERELLEVPESVALFSIERIGELNSRAVEWRHTLVRGDRFAVSTQFSGLHGFHMDVVTDAENGTS